MNEELETPCYIISTDGFRDTVSYKDDWCYGPSRHIATISNGDARDRIKADIRECPGERNGLPIYFVSDHGNVSRRRAIRLRKL